MAETHFMSQVRAYTTILHRYRLRWLIPTLAGVVLAFAYAFLGSAKWEAAQGLVVRDEGTAKPDRPGRFVNADDMKTVQETVQELAKSKAVLEAALQQLGLPADEKSVEALQGGVKIAPPKGLEFGKTEVFYLKVQGSSRSQAIDLNNAVCEQLQARFADLRNVRAKSLADELTKSVGLAKEDLQGVTAKLTELEQQVGSDLSELRMLNDSPSGDSDLRRSMTEIQNEIRQQQAGQKANEELIALLTAAQDDPHGLLAMPNKLLESQPALKRLKDGLVEAQLRTAQMSSTMSDEHPQLVAARQNEEEVATQLRAEIGTAIRGLQVEQTMHDNRITQLEKQLNDGRGRIAKLATIRADYGNLVAETKQRTEILKNAQQALAEARASQASSRVSSTITKVGVPDTGSRPAGPSKTQTLVLGGFLGLIAGVGLLFLTVPGPQVPHRQHTIDDFVAPPAEVAFELNHGKRPVEVGLGDDR